MMSKEITGANPANQNTRRIEMKKLFLFIACLALAGNGLALWTTQYPGNIWNVQTFFKQCDKGTAPLNTSALSVNGTEVINSSGVYTGAVTGGAVTASEVNVSSAAGVKITGDGDGAVTFLGMGNGSDEDVTLNLDDTSNVGLFTSSTSLATLRFGAIALAMDNGATAAGSIKFYEDSDNGANTATLIGPASTADVVITLGAATGTLRVEEEWDASSEMAAFMDDETGSGALVFATSPTLVTPVIGAATGTSLIATGAISGLVETQLDMLNPTVNTDNALSEDCEAGDAAGWTESHDTAWDVADDAVIYRVGTGSLSFTTTLVNTPADGDVCYLVVASANWANVDMVGFWIYSATTIAAGDVNLYVYDGAGGTTTNETDVGAVTAATWTYKRISIAAFVKGDVDRIGFALTAQGAAKAFVMQVDNLIHWDDTNTTNLTQVPTFNGLRGAWYTGDQAADTHTAVAGVENTTFFLNYSGTGNEFISLIDLSAQLFFLQYNY